MKTQMRDTKHKFIKLPLKLYFPMKQKLNKNNNQNYANVVFPRNEDHLSHPLYEKVRKENLTEQSGMQEVAKWVKQ